MRWSLLSFCFFFVFPLFAQDLHIYLDVHTEEITYISGKDTLDQPQVKTGDQVYVHLINYNNYLYDVEIEKEGKVNRFSTPTDTLGLGTDFLPELKGFSGQGLFSMLQGLGGGLGLDFSVSGPTGLFQMMGLNPGIKGVTVNFDAADPEQQAQMIAAEYRNILSEIRAIEVDLQRIDNALDRAIQAKLLQGKVAQQIRTLQLNPNLQPKQIQRLTHEYMDLVFEKTNVEELDMERIWAISNRQEAIQHELAKAANGQVALGSKVEQLERLQKKMEVLSALEEPSIAGLGDLKSSVDGTCTRMTSSLKRMKENLERIEAETQQLPEDDFEELVALRYLYEELSANDFSYTYRTVIKNDLTEFDIRLIPKSGLPGKIVPLQRTLEPLEIPARGAFKVSAGLGLSFARFFNPPQAYFLRDTMIQSEDEDSFSPHLTSFIHFYRQSLETVSYGGSFGIGIPIFNGEGGQSVSFFLGPSVMFGDRQRLVLTGGIMGGRVQRLGQGYQVGDSLPAGSPSIPTDFRFQLGYFLGLTFNVSG